MGRVRNVALAALATVATIGVVSFAAAAEPELAALSGNRTNPVKVVESKSQRGRQSRIVGGRVVGDLDRETGSQFFAKIFTPDGTGFYCAGSLVSPSHVLTRAGCDVQTGDVVRVGGTKLFGGLEYKVSKVNKHPGFDPVGDIHDIAMLTLSKPRSEASMIRAGVAPVALNFNFGTPHGFYVAGFGATDKKAATAGSLQLKRGYQPLRSWEQCEAIFKQVRLPNGKLLPINKSAQVCTNYLSFQSGALCDRDVGGPMFRADTKWIGGVKTTQYTLYAVSSFWIGTAEERCPQGLPNVGTKVAYYKQWIQAAMA
ncbi:hypothetical protein MMPV_006334 [Pyropia vietnamensis]